MTTVTYQPRCEHPEDRRGPLPYAGRPALADEWECLDCGMTHVSPDAVVRTSVRLADKDIDKLLDSLFLPVMTMTLPLVGTALSHSDVAFSARTLRQEAKELGGVEVAEDKLILTVDMDRDSTSEWGRLLDRGVHAARAFSHVLRDDHSTWDVELRLDAAARDFSVTTDLGAVLERGGRGWRLEAGREVYFDFWENLRSQSLQYVPMPTSTSRWTLYGVPFEHVASVPDDHLVAVLDL